MYKWIKALFEAGKLTREQVVMAVNKNWITVDQCNAILRIQTEVPA